MDIILKLYETNKAKGGGKIMSKIVDANKKIKKAVVGGYKKVEDKFVDTFLKKDGETVEEAKERLQKEQQEREKESHNHIKSTVIIQSEIKEKYNE